MEQIIREVGLDLRHPAEAGLAKVGAALQKADKKGIWLVTPSPLSIDQDRDTTIFGFDLFSTLSRQGRYFRNSAVIVGTRVESRETFAELVNEPKEKRPKPPSPPSEEDETQADMDMLARFSIPLRQRLANLPWRAGTYIVDVLFDGQVSSRGRFELTSGEAARKDPAVAAFIEARKAAGEQPKELYPAPVAGQKYPNFEKNDQSLEIPADMNIQLSADRVAVYKDDGHSILKGSYRLHVPASFYRDAGSAPLTAVVPISLVITGNLMTGPFVVPMLLPSQQKIEENSAESVITGQFEIDLFALNETSKVPQTYTIWAYSGDVRSAPATAAFITPEMLK